jgi:aminoglycoside phosphotransferase (APT) family kinase protein
LSVGVKGATIPSFPLEPLSTVRLPASPRWPWHDDHRQTAAAAALTVAADVPELSNRRAERLGEGWDYSAFLVADEWVFRFPKRRFVARALLREVRTLAALRPLLAGAGLEVPHYRYVVEHPVRFPVAYAGYRFLPGAALHTVPATSGHAAAVGAAIGRFLARLHASAPSPRPVNVTDDFAAHIADFRRELEVAAPTLPPGVVAAARTLLDRPPPPWRGEVAFVHGDLGAEHVLCDATHTPCAIIDWGDASWGNPLGDFVGLHAWGGDAAARAAFAAAGRDPDGEAWRRLRQWSACYAIGTFHYGYKAGQEVLRAAGLEWLTRMHRHGQLLDPGRDDA